MKYKITTLFSVPDWYVLRQRLFGDAQPIFEEWTTNGSTFLVTVPDSAPPPADLGPLVKVERVEG